MHHPDLLNEGHCLCSGPSKRLFICRGGQARLEEKSPLMITGAEQVSNGATHFEINTMSGAKRQKEDADDPSDISMHYEEKIGEVEYAFEGAIDLKELQFISMSETYDRLAVNPDRSENYRKSLSAALGSAVDVKRYYCMKHSVIRTPEEGVLLNQLQVVAIDSGTRKTASLPPYSTLKGLCPDHKSRSEDCFRPSIRCDGRRGGWRPIRQPDDLKINPEAG